MDNSTTPLIVDLDHTLIDTDLLFLSSLGVLTKSPWLIGHYFFWLWKGKGYLKDQLVRRFEINIPELPYNDSVIGYIMQRKKRDVKLFLQQLLTKIMHLLLPSISRFLMMLWLVIRTLTYRVIIKQKP